MAIKKLLTFILIFSSFITLKSMEREYEGDKKLEQDEEKKEYTKFETLTITKRQSRTSQRFSKPINFRELKNSGVNIKEEIENQYNEQETLAKQRLVYRHEISEIINILFDCISRNDDEKFKETFAKYSTNPDIVNARNKGGLTLAIIAAENLLNKNKASKFGVNKLKAVVKELFTKESAETAFEKARQILYEILCPTEDGGYSARNECLKLGLKTDRGSLETYLRKNKATLLANQVHQEKQTDQEKLDILKNKLSGLQQELKAIKILQDSNNEEEIRKFAYKVKYSKIIANLKSRWEAEPYEIDKKQYYVSYEAEKRGLELDVRNMSFGELNKFIREDLDKLIETVENLSLEQIKKDIEDYCLSKTTEYKKTIDKINNLKEKMKS